VTLAPVLPAPEGHFSTLQQLYRLVELPRTRRRPASPRRNQDTSDHTCNNWTSDAMTLPQQNPNIPADRARAMLGHTDRSGGGNVSWNAAHMSQGCTKQALINTGGAGRFYCFATN
jgi:hypothetical protein